MDMVTEHEKHHKVTVPRHRMILILRIDSVVVLTAPCNTALVF